jgi:cytochrome c553
MRITKDIHGHRRFPIQDSRTLLCLVGTIVLASAASGGRADETDVALQMRAQKVAITVCGTCHGKTGTNTQPKFPVLAAQNANYLITQLKAFHAQTRGDPDAIAYMWGMAAELDEPSMSALAGYYSAQKPQPGSLGRTSICMASRAKVCLPAAAAMARMRTACRISRGSPASTPSTS